MTLQLSYQNRSIQTKKSTPSLAGSLGLSMHEVLFLEASRLDDVAVDDKDRIRIALDVIYENSDSESGSILLASPDRPTLYFADAWGPSAHAVFDHDVPLSRGLAGFCARTGTCVVVDSALRDGRFYDVVANATDYRIDNLCAAPIQEEGFVFGVIQLMNKPSGAYSEEEVRALAYLGRMLGKGIWQSNQDAPV
jgi:signal transduction protein with GAF and PtsI domain